MAFRSALREGTLIVSAGLGGVYPRGIPVGTVVSELRTAEGWARNYLLRPAVRLVDVTTVMVVQPRRAKEGVAAVWQTAVDSALRMVVGAGDSLAKLRTDSLATAERARFDSLQALRPRPDALPATTPRPDSVPPRRARPDTLRAVKPPADSGAAPAARPRATP